MAIKFNGNTNMLEKKPCQIQFQQSISQEMASSWERDDSFEKKPRIPCPCPAGVCSQLEDPR